MIKWFKRILLILILSATVVLGLVFTVQNHQPTSLIFLHYTLPQLSLGLWVTILLFTGCCIGFFLSFLPFLWGYQSRAAKNRKIQALEKELNRLRAFTLKD